MPHLKLECSHNIKEKIDPKKIFEPCHQILSETIKADISNCQSFAVVHPHFYIGNGNAHEAVIQLRIIIKEGRTPEVLLDAKKKILHVLEKYFAESLKTLNVQLSVYIVEFAPSHYGKIESRPF